MKPLFKHYQSCPIYSIIILIIALSLTQAGCKEEEEKEPTILVKIDKSLYPFVFDTGSSWIYTRVNLIKDTIPVKHPESSEKKDSIIIIRDTTHVTLDTIQVESVEKDTLYILDNVRFYEYYNIKYHSTFGDSVFNEQLIGYAITRGQMNGGFLLLSSKKANDKSMNAQVVNVINELKVEDITYKQVVKMRVGKDQFISNDYFFYYVDRIGVIRKEKLFVDTKLKKDSIVETWNLKSHLVQLLKVQ